MKTRISIEAPAGLIKKLDEFSKEKLSKEEKSALNAVFGVYDYAMKNRCCVFKENQSFLKEINDFEAEVEAEAIMSTPLVTTITLTTTLASHPWIGCSIANASDECICE